MTDAIGTNTYTSSRQISSEQAAAYEAQLESNTLAALNANKSELSDLCIKLASDQDLTPEDAEELMKMSEGLTSADIDNLVASGQISRQEGDLLLAASTLGHFNTQTPVLDADGKPTYDADGHQVYEDTTADPQGVADGLNKLFNDMSGTDRDFVLNTFADQGAYKRSINVDFENTDTNGNPTLSYSLATRTGVTDLPSNTEIQRATVFLMSGSSPMDDNGKVHEGAVQAFTNWDFATANDEMAALLGGLPSYENMSPLQQSELVNYILASGMVADGDVAAGSVSAERRTEIETERSSLETMKADHEAFEKALQVQINEGDVADLNKETFTLSDGTTVTFKEYCDQMTIPYPNTDGDDKCGTTELKALLDNVKGHETTFDGKLQLLDLEASGADEETLKSMRLNLQEQIKTEKAQEFAHAWNMDHKHGDDDKLNVNDLTFSYQVICDEEGNAVAPHPYVDENGDYGMSMRDYLLDSEIGFGDASNTAGMSWKNLDDDSKLGKNEVDILEQSLAGHRNDLGNESTAIQGQVKADWPGGQDLIDSLRANADQQQDWEACRVAMMQAQDDWSSAGGFDAANTYFTDHNGNNVSVDAFLTQNHVEYKHHDGNNVVDKAEVDRLTDTVIPGQVSDLQKSYNETSKQLQNLKPPHESETVRRTEGSGYGPMQNMNVSGTTQPGRSGGVEGDPENDPEDYEPVTPSDDPNDLGMKGDFDDEVWEFINEADPDRSVIDGESKFWDAFDAWQDRRHGHDHVGGDDKPGRVEGGDGPGRRDGPGGKGDVGDGRPSADWDPNKKNAFDDAVRDMQNGEVQPPEDTMSQFGLSEADLIDIGMLMFIIMGDRVSMLGQQIQDIIKEQQKNTNDQADMNKAIAALNTHPDGCDLQETTITLSDGSTTNLADYFDAHGVAYANDDGDYYLGKDEVQYAITNCKNSGEGLANEGTAIMNELNMLSQRYQQAVSLMNNMLDKFDAMKQKIIDKIRAN